MRRRADDIGFYCRSEGGAHSAVYRRVGMVSAVEESSSQESNLCKESGAVFRFPYVLG